MRTICRVSWLAVFLLLPSLAFAEYAIAQNGIIVTVPKGWYVQINEPRDLLLVFPHSGRVVQGIALTGTAFISIRISGQKSAEETLRVPQESLRSKRHVKRVCEPDRLCSFYEVTSTMPGTAKGDYILVERGFVQNGRIITLLFGTYEHDPDRKAAKEFEQLQRTIRLK